jgi:transcriptional regulator with XRE-family HTH domain
MADKRLDQSGLAGLSGVSPSAVSRHMDRETAPRADSMAKYCSALGVSYDWLARGRGTKHATEPEPIPQALQPKLGLDALEYVLVDYEWPPGLEGEVMDAACADLRREAAAAGAGRPASVWRALLDGRFAARGSHVRQRATGRR